MLDALAVVLERPNAIALRRLALSEPTPDDIVVSVRWSGVSTGTERLLYTGRMPDFPGMGYPLVPGYESVGTVEWAGDTSGYAPGDMLFVPGARCFGDVRGLFGGAASRLVTKADRVVKLPSSTGEGGILLALAATAQHALATSDIRSGALIVGHGVLGRLLARLCVLAGGDAPTVWEKNPARAVGATDYRVIDPQEDQRRNYRTVFDVSGDARILDTLMMHLAPGGEIVLAGFYEAPLSFAFPPAFMREARIRVAAQWQSDDLHLVSKLVASGALSLAGLITHRRSAEDAIEAYPVAFDDPACLKMALDWSTYA